MRENMTIFAMSCLTASHLIYNLMHIIREDHLQNLQLFTEYGRLAAAQTGSKPFQNLLFLVRDWHYPHEAEFGLSGGRKILENILENSQESGQEFSQLRQHIGSSFQAMDCFLLPYPGPKVAEDPNFRGSASDFDPRFGVHLEDLVTRVLAPSQLVPKKVGERVLKSREMVDYFQKYLDIFTGDQIPEPKSIYDTTVQISNLHAAGDAKEKYVELMELGECGNKALGEDDLQKLHCSSLASSLDLFHQLARFGGAEARLTAAEALKNDLRLQFDQMKRLNTARILNVYHESKDLYEGRMTTALAEDNVLLPEAHLEDLHQENVLAALAHFETPKGVPLSAKLAEELRKEFKYRFLHYQSLNGVKIDTAVRGEQQRCLVEYRRTIEAVLEGPFSVNPLKLEYEHANASKMAVETFAKNSHFGGRHADEGRKRLEADLAAQLSLFKERNSAKRMTVRIRTTLDQLSDNETYRDLWRDVKTRQYVTVSVISVICLKYIFGS